ncbi:MAG: DUF5680 domain-containing protein [Eubacteriales bacterium]|nr:DUF5680 domain-containing protein [Eubacteriales bacterium]
MTLEDKLQFLRKQAGYSQEQLADALGVSRQTVGKWENGQAVPELYGLMELSRLYHITIDRIVKDDDDCNLQLRHTADMDIDEAVHFLLRAKKATYAGHGQEIAPCRIASHDLEYREGPYYYLDTYLGGERFIGEEAIWHNDVPLWSMNYSGRVTGENFSGDFLKEALSLVPYETPYRGPAIYQNGEYSYHCRVEGAFVWYQGYEEIFYREDKIYECFFHGGIIK